MVTEHGMSDNLGPMTFGNKEDEVFMGRILIEAEIIVKVAAAIDKEIEKLLRKPIISPQLLEENINKLHRVAERLLEKEKIDR